MLQLQVPHRRLQLPICSTSAASGSRRGGAPRRAAIAVPRCLDCGPASTSLRGGRDRRGRGWRCAVGGRESMWSGPERREEQGEFIEASLLVPETVRHYSLLRQGFLEETKWHSSSRVPLFVQKSAPHTNANSISHGFLRRFQSPTIFLKLYCDCDLLLPIVVGEFGIERFLESLENNRNEGCPSQLQFMNNIVGVLGHKVEMVQITKRVMNTYYSNIVLNKPGERTDLSVDSRPSDALSLANVLKVPIFVSKDIVLSDAIKIASGSWRNSSSKTVYDVVLDSAIEGHDYLSEELGVIKKLNMAVHEERYSDAVIWRDKLTEIRTPRQDSQAYH